jgi:hypothetical protein
MSQVPGVREKPGLHVLWRCLGFHTVFSLGELKAARTMFPLSHFEGVASVLTFAVIRLRGTVTLTCES